MSTPAQETEYESALAAVLADAWEEGSPVAGQTDAARSELAAVALRRIRSFERRGVDGSDSARAIKDLAKGLVAHFERDPKLVGPLIEDCRYVARKLIEAYRKFSSGSMPNTSLERTRGR